VEALEWHWYGVGKESQAESRDMNPRIPNTQTGVYPHDSIIESVKDHKYSELYINTQSVPRCKHTPSRL